MTACFFTHASDSKYTDVVSASASRGGSRGERSDSGVRSASSDAKHNPVWLPSLAQWHSRSMSGRRVCVVVVVVMVVSYAADTAVTS